MTRRELVHSPSFGRAWEATVSRASQARGGEPGGRVAPRLRELLGPRAMDHDDASVKTGAAARRAVPENPHLIDPTWFLTGPAGEPVTPGLGLRMALTLLPAPVAASVCRLAGLSPVSGPLRAAPPLPLVAARALWCHLEDMPEERPASEPLRTPEAPSSARALAEQPTDAIREAVARAGVAPFGALLRHLPDRAAAGLCARLPEPLREAVWRARQRHDPEGPSRHDLMRLHAQRGAADPAELLFALGAGQLGPLLRRHAPEALRQVAQKLPAPAGRLLLEAPEAGALQPGVTA